MKGDAWDEHALFGEGYLAVRTTRPAPKTVEATPAPQEERMTTTMERRLLKPMREYNAPPLWRCNARTQHYPDGIECRELIDKAPQIRACTCALCMRQRYPYLEEGPPWVPEDHPEVQEMLEHEFVGLYEPAPYMQLEPLCAMCGKPIKIDGKTASKFQQNEEDIIHVACLSSVDAQCLHGLTGGTYALPYIIRKQRPDKEECDGSEGKGEGGGPDGGGGT